MDEAHAYISVRDMNFEGMEKYLCIDQTTIPANASSKILSTFNASQENSRKSALRKDSSTKLSDKTRISKKGKKKK